MSNRRDIQFLYNPHNKATLIDCSFTVDSSNASGITSLNKSGRISSVFMHTSTTPASGNPNPQNGIIIVNLQDNYNRYLGGFEQTAVPTTGSSISSGMTAGNVYVITVLGTTTTAQWHTAGVPANVTPAVGVAFVSAVTSFSGTGKVKAIAAAGSGINSIELIGNPILANSNGAYTLGAGNGTQIIMGCYGISSVVTMASYTPTGTVSAPVLTMDSYTPAGTNNGATPPIFTGTPATLTGTNSAPTFTGAAATLTGTVASTKILAAPADGTLINLAFYLNNSAQGV